MRGILGEFARVQNEVKAMQAEYAQGLRRVEALRKTAARKALAVDPDNIDALMMLGLQAGTFEGRFADALRCFRRILQLQPNHPTAGNYVQMALSGLERQKA